MFEHKNKRRIIKDKNIITFDFQRNVFDNYLTGNNIEILDKKNFKYGECIQNSNLCRLLSTKGKNKDSCSNYLDFVERYNSYKIPAYEFSVNSNNYWNDKSNRIRNFKKFIEIEIDLDCIEKLPIYFTKMFIKYKSNTLANVLRKYYNNDLFELADELFPNKFKPEEFNIHHAQEYFDSEEEMYIHKLLKEKFDKSLIYNSGKANNHLFSIGKYKPDWLVTYEKPIIIEYFGMVNHKMLDSYGNRYNDRHLNKINYYDNLKSYEKIYFYPNDLKNDFKGVKNKLSKY